MKEGKQSKIKIEVEEIEWTKNKIQVGTLKKRRKERKGQSRRRRNMTTKRKKKRKRKKEGHKGPSTSSKIQAEQHIVSNKAYHIQIEHES